MPVHYLKSCLQQECIPVGCVPTAAAAISWGVWLPGGGLVSAYLWQTPPKADIPPTPYPLPCEQTDACENITFPHSSYAVGNDIQMFFVDYL